MNEWRDKITKLLGYMKDHAASDMHITVGLPPYLRVDGKIIPTQLPVLNVEESENLIFSILTEVQIKQFKRKKVLDCSYGEKELGRFRLNVYMQRGTIACAIRRLPSKIPDLEELGLPIPTIKSLCNLTQGLVLVAGPVGSGKTTTLASMVQYICLNRSCHVITIEEPIEYIYKSGKSLIHQREIHTDTLSFADALKHGLREDPDVILIGEMRDLETISTAVTIAETGHLVLATLHTGDTSESVSRIVDVFPAVQQAQVSLQLSSTLEGVINQLLIPTANGSGRVLATEVMIATAAIRSIIRENKIDKIYSHIQLGTKYGMHTMNQSLYKLTRNSTVNKDAVIAVSSRPKELKRMISEEEYG